MSVYSERRDGRLGPSRSHVGLTSPGQHVVIEVISTAYSLYVPASYSIGQLTYAYSWYLGLTRCSRRIEQTSISVNADGPRDTASRKIDHIALHAECNNN